LILRAARRAALLRPAPVLPLSPACFPKRGDSFMRAIRGATTAAADTREEILLATKELLQAMVRENSIEVYDIISIIFTTTRDLVSCFPAEAARELGWSYVPLLCAVEVPVKGDVPRCIRVLMHVASSLPARDIRHIYLRGARVLRPDLSGGSD